MKEPKTFHFGEQFNFGNKGESDFLKYYKAIKSSDRAYDFILNKETVEIKTESRTLEQTPNFFIERYSDIDKLKPGGPWQSINTNYFIYYFINDKTFFWFKSKELCSFLDIWIETQKPIYIKNRTYTSVGFKVPRDIVSHLLIKVDKFY